MDNRCWIIGNGKSLKVKHLEKLDGEITFATNMISKLYDKTDWRPTYYTGVSTSVVVPEYKPWILRAIKECDTALVSEEVFYHLDPNDIYDAIPLDVDREHLFWSEKFYDKVSAWGMSHLVSFQFAVEELCVSEIYLLGFDLGFKVPTKDEDPNHFSNDYCDYKYMLRRSEGQQSYYDELEKDHIITHKFIKERTSDKDVRVFNSTFGGKLSVYPRRSFYKTLRGELEEEI